MFRINLALACISQWEARTILHGRHVPMEQIYKKMDRQATKTQIRTKKKTDTEIESEIRHAKKAARSNNPTLHDMPYIVMA